MNTGDLITDCMNYAFECGISCRILPFPVKTDPSMVFVKHRMIVINRNYIKHRQLPFQICHEIAHILNGDDFLLRNYCDYPVSLGMEFNADKRALHILIPLYLNYIDYYADNTVIPIMRTLCIPFHLINYVVRIARPLVIPISI